MNNFEKIEAYTAGWMSEQERAAFETELRDDEMLREDYDDWVSSDKILKRHFSADREAESLKEILAPLTGQYFSTKEKPAAKVVSFKKYLFAAAAVAAILIIFFSLPGIESYPVPDMPQAVVRGAADLSNKGAQLFNEKKYEAALPLLQQQADAGQEDATARFFYGVCLIKTKKYEPALPVLDKLTKGASVYKEDACFFAALAAYKLDQKQAAVAYAQQVPRGSEYFKQAQRILRKLR